MSRKKLILFVLSCAAFTYPLAGESMNDTVLKGTYGPGGLWQVFLELDSQKCIAEVYAVDKRWPILINKDTLLKCNEKSCIAVSKIQKLVLKKGNYRLMGRKGFWLFRSNIELIKAPESRTMLERYRNEYYVYSDRKKLLDHFGTDKADQIDKFYKEHGTDKLCEDLNSSDFQRKYQILRQEMVAEFSDGK